MAESYVIVDDIGQAEEAARGHVLESIQSHYDEGGIASSIVFEFRDGLQVAVASPDMQILEVRHADTG